MTEIDNELYAATQILGRDMVIDLARALVRARKLHPDFADGPKTGAEVVRREAVELWHAAHKCESPDRQKAEALDTAVTAIRFMGAEWLPEFGDRKPADAFETKKGDMGHSGQQDAGERLVRETVNHPAHYTAYPVEVIDMVRLILGEEGFQAYCLGNEIKYRMRAGLKGDAAEDLAKAMKYKEFRLASA